MTLRTLFRHDLARGHCTDEDLIAAWHEDRTPAHLEVCEACAARSVELRAWLDTVRDAAAEEADEVFTPERLEAQQAHILRRLERLGHPGRVISFPAMRRSAPVVHLVARRWVAMAAAAGLLIGIVAGRFVDFRPSGAERSARTSSQIANARSNTLLSTSFDTKTFNEEAFLSELETAAAAPRIEELQAIDALTPHVREVPVTLVR